MKNIPLKSRYHQKIHEALRNPNAFSHFSQLEAWTTASSGESSSPAARQRSVPCWSSALAPMFAVGIEDCVALW